VVPRGQHDEVVLTLSVTGAVALGRRKGERGDRTGLVCELLVSYSTATIGCVLSIVCAVSKRVPPIGAHHFYL
jgi:hypothetical protein